MPGAQAYWVATIRETFEEAGVLLALEPSEIPGEEQPVDPARIAAGEFEHWREGLNAGSTTMRAVLDGTGLLLDGSRLGYVARFVTPVGPPRRYDARFFVTIAPEAQVASADNDEAVGHAWISPAEALRRHEDGAMAMMTPTLACLMRLGAYPTADAAVDAAISASIDQRMRIDRSLEGVAGIMFEGDAGYDAASESEFGWLGF